MIRYSLTFLSQTYCSSGLVTRSAVANNLQKDGLQLHRIGYLLFYGRPYSLYGESEPGLVCRIKCKGPEHNIGILLDDYKYYRNLKLDLLEMRASDPKPLLSLKYNFRKNT